ncbi:hypothetical protein ACFQ07_34225 [Actinomadura adrarensis]|uniref:HNH endonuclease n=1 Tax=Actinomadura adrarensis TaxID=1819600 RepID=A0ABW3CV20_9ACTN
MSNDFFWTDPSARASWRLAVLMGANSRTYKFALAESLLTIAAEGRTDAPLTELAAPYAMGLVRHLKQAPQAPSGSGGAGTDFLKIAEREAEESLRLGQPTEELLQAAVRNMPGMVMRKFHNVGRNSQVKHRFYESTGSSRERIVRFTPELQKVAVSEHAHLLREELGARWNIVESSFASGIGRSLIEEGVAVDLESLRIQDRRRRRSITGIREATIGFQHGRCVICGQSLAADDEYAVDHAFPFALMNRFRWDGPDLDSFWNLAPAHASCNSHKSDALPTHAHMTRLAERNEAIMNSPHPLRKTLELTLKAAKYSSTAPGSWRRFVRDVHKLIVS